MKTILARLAPGFFATLGAIALGFFCILKAQNKTETPAPSIPAQDGGRWVHESDAAQPAHQLLVCGACGAQLQAPQVVMVAAPVNAAQGVDGRAAYAPRPAAYATDAYYPEPAAERVVYIERGVSPYAYAPAYYDRPVSCDPFGEIRVNPIPFYPGQERARFEERPRIGREFVAPQHVHRN